MDIEQTIQFILQSQGRAEIRMEKAANRMAKADNRVNALEKAGMHLQSLEAGS